MKNTHAKTHSNYTAEIVQIFRISKDGEADNFSKVVKFVASIHPKSAFN